MIKKTVTYIDYKGEERTETCFFNLNRVEVLDMQMTTIGGYTEKLQALIDAKNTAELYKLFKDLVLRSYGVISEDGKRFEKNDKLREEFEQTEAYVTIYMELATNTDKAIEFINGITPDFENKANALNDAKAIAEK